MGYTYYNPLKVWLDPASIADVVSYMQTYLEDNPIKDTEEINQIIADYIAAHPEIIGGVQSVNGETGAVVLTASDIETTETTTIQEVLTSLSSQISNIEQILNTKEEAEFSFVRVNGTSVPGKMMQVNSALVMSEYSAAYGSYRSFSVNSGEIWKVTASSNNAYRPSVIYALNGSFVSSIAVSPLIDYEIKIPDGVDTMYINGGVNVDGTRVMPAALKQGNKIGFSTRVEEALNIVSIEEIGFSPVSGENKAYTYGEASTTTGAAYEYVSLPVNHGETYYVTAIGQKATLCIYDENYYLVKQLVGVAEQATDFKAEIPTNGYFMLVNGYVASGIIIKKEILVSNSKEEANPIYLTGKKFYDYLHHDNFHRANNNESLGSNGDSTHDMSYTVLTSGKVCGIIDNAAFCVQSSFPCVAVRELNVSDFEADVQVDLSYETDGTHGCGMAFRVSDASNYWAAFRRSTFVAVSKYVNGTATRLAYIYSNPGGAYIKKISVSCKGNKILLSIDGFPRAVIFDDFNSTATKFGLFWEGQSLGRINYIDLRVQKEKTELLDILDDGVQPPYWISENNGQPYSYSFVQNVVHNSKYSNRFEIRKADNYKRSEIRLPQFYNQLGEQIVSFDIMLGNDYAINDPSEIITQFHDTPENNDSTTDNAKLAPDLALYIKDGHYIIRQQWDENKNATPSNLAHYQETDIGEISEDIGKWVSWFWHVKWSYAEFFEPITELYKNGLLVYSSKNPNTVNASNAAYFKIGCYQWNYVDHPELCNSVSRTLWVDNIKVIS